MNGLVRKGVGVTLAGTNAVGFGLFWYDKEQAKHHGWRVPEKTLCMTALVSGMMVVKVG